jgi:proteasome lid subunit RPN8/RPN11
MHLPIYLQNAIARHARACYPEESCGLVIDAARYVPCLNTSSTPREAFAISPADWAAAEDLGDITEVVHSHPDGAAFPSGADFSAQAATGLPWVIVALGPDGVRGWYEFGA